MELLAFCIYDTKAELFQRPFFAPTDGSAIRAVVDEGRRPGSELGAHPTDYVLFCVGAFDDSTGALGGFTPRNMGLVKSLISSDNKASIEKLDKGPPNEVGDES